MPIKFLFLSFSCCWWLAVPGLAQQINYTIEVQPTASGNMKIGVDLEFYHGNEDTIYIPIPTQLMQSTGLRRCYRNWSATGGRVLQTDDSSFVSIKRLNSNSPTMRVHYDIFPAASGPSVMRSNSAGPIIQPDYIHIRGYSLLLAPIHYQTYSVKVVWKTLPKKWTIQNSFNAGSKVQEFTFTNRNDWRRTNWVAGDFRLYEDEVYGKPVHFAIRGNWLFEDTTLFRVILKTVQTQRDQWDDRDMKYYSVTLIPYVMHRNPGERDAESLCVGYGLYQSFVICADEECLLAPFTDLFNHEMMHEWIGGRIDEGVPKDGIDLSWFSEGFTEYYALRNRWKAGFIDGETFFKELNNDFFKEHYSSSFAELTNIDSRARRWEEHDLERLAYRRGCIAAFYLDMDIRVKSEGKNTLFDFMGDLMDYTYGTGRNLTESYVFFTEALSEYEGDGVEDWLDTYIEKGKKIPPSSFSLPPFLKMQQDTDGVPQFDLNPAVPNAKALFLKD